jgi:uncharacterized coiled-coil DUF342 family protein
MTDDDLIRRLTALRQQIDDLTMCLTDSLHQLDKARPEADAHTELVAQITELQTELADRRAELRNAGRARPDMVRHRGEVLSVDPRLARRNGGAEHQHPAS